MNKPASLSVYKNETMKTSILIAPALILAALPVLTGCVERRVVYVQTPPEVAAQPGRVITEAPPAPPAEVLVPPPGPNYVWLPGYWSWQGRWVWIGGAWTVRPYAHAHWVPGHWAHRGYGWIWVGGHWR
jgi:hypothetical protein